MIQHVHERGIESSAREVVVATDDQRIADACDLFGATVCMTGDQHRSGSERIAEVCDIMDWDDNTVVVNLQGDEPRSCIAESAQLVPGDNRRIQCLHWR